jgi:hypothetical protein
MTVIVKPRIPETSDELITDYLTDLLGDLPFEAFQTTTTGNLTLLGTKFYMRIGKFLGQPSQAIIAQQQFVKMRHVDKYDKRSLKVIDPKEPDACLYSNGTGPAETTPTWCPPPYVDFEEQAKQVALLQAAMAQAQMMAAQGIQGIGQAQNPYWQNQFGNQDIQNIKAQMDALKAQAQSKYAPPQIYGTFEDENDTRSWWQRIARV